MDNNIDVKGNININNSLIVDDDINKTQYKYR